MKRLYLKGSPRERLWQRVIKTDGCWMWTGSKAGAGYGVMQVNHAHIYVHRLSWEIRNGGPIPEGMEVMHECDTPACVRPDHLKLGTHDENMKDMITKGRRNARGAIGERNSGAILTTNDVLRIRYLRGRGWKVVQIAEAFCIGTRAIGRVLLRRSWGHV